MKRFLLAASALVGATTLAHAQPVFTRAGGIQAPGTNPAYLLQPNGMTQGLSVMPTGGSSPASLADVAASAIAGLPATALGTTSFTASGSAQRTLSARFADTINIREYGATCDGATNDAAALQAALNAAAAKGYARLLIPNASCLIAANTSVSLGANQGVTIEGAGNGSALLFPAGISGPAITLNATTAGFGAHDLSFLRQPDGGGTAGTGLTVQMAPGVANSVPVHLSNLHFNGFNRADSWQTAMALTSLADPTIDAVSVQQPDAVGSASGPTGLLITGLSNSQFAIDAKISNSSFQGGHANILLVGSVQGVFVENSEGVGSDYGIYGADDGTHYAELVKVSGSHWNNTMAGISLTSYGDNLIVGNLFFHFNPSTSVPYRSVQLLNSGYNTVALNQGNGAKVGDEELIQITNGQFQVVVGNQATTFGGNCIDMATGGNANSTLSSNLCSNVQGTILPPVGSNIALAGNTVDGSIFDVGMDGTGTAQIGATKGLNSPNGFNTNGSTNSGQFFASTGAGYGFVIGGNAYNVLTSTGATNATLAGSLANLALGYSGTTVTVPGTLTASGNVNIGQAFATNTAGYGFNVGGNVYNALTSMDSAHVSLGSSIANVILGYSGSTVSVPGAMKVTGNLTAPTLFSINTAVSSTGGLIFQKSDGTFGPTFNLDGGASQVNLSSGFYAQGSIVSNTDVVIGPDHSLILSDNSGAAGAAVQAGYFTADATGGAKLATLKSGGVASLDYTGYTLAALPSNCTPGQTAYIIDGRNAGEVAGAGSGLLGYCNNSHKWYANGALATN